jgi:hypothetical protein
LIGIGQNHTFCLMLMVLAYGCCVSSLLNFGAFMQGASTVCFGVDGAVLTMYALFLGADLDAQLKIPQFGSFFWLRIGMTCFHIVMELVRSFCGGGKDTVGTMAHMASFIAGICYFFTVLPPMGDGTLFDTPRPYIVGCDTTNPRGMVIKSNKQCLALFTRSFQVELWLAKTIGTVILLGGFILAGLNAYKNRHISDDGVACCMCGDVPPSNEGPAQAPEQNGLPPGIDMAALQSIRRQMEQLAQMQQQRQGQVPGAEAPLIQSAMPPTTGNAGNVGPARQPQVSQDPALPPQGIPQVRQPA